MSTHSTCAAGPARAGRSWRSPSPPVGAAGRHRRPRRPSRRRPVTAGADWLAGQLTDGSDAQRPVRLRRLGLTIDAALALAAAGGRRRRCRRSRTPWPTTCRQLHANGADSSAPTTSTPAPSPRPAFGPEAGGDPTDYGGHDLVADAGGPRRHRRAAPSAGTDRDDERLRRLREHDGPGVRRPAPRRGKLAARADVPLPAPAAVLEAVLPAGLRPRTRTPRPVLRRRRRRRAAPTPTSPRSLVLALNGADGGPGRRAGTRRRGVTGCWTSQAPTAPSAGGPTTEAQRQQHRLAVWALGEPARPRRRAGRRLGPRPPGRQRRACAPLGSTATPARSPTTTGPWPTRPRRRHRRRHLRPVPPGHRPGPPRPWSGRRRPGRPTCSPRGYAGPAGRRRSA